MSITRCVSKIMDRIAPLTLAEKWDNVSSFSLVHGPQGLGLALFVLIAVHTLAWHHQVGLLLGHYRPSPSLFQLRSDG